MIGISSIVLDLSFFDTYIIPIVSVCVAIYGTLLARKEKLDSSERMVRGLRDQFLVDRMLLKLIEHSASLTDDIFKKSLLDQIELVTIVLQHTSESFEKSN